MLTASKGYFPTQVLEKNFIKNDVARLSPEIGADLIQRGWVRNVENDLYMVTTKGLMMLKKLLS